MKFIDKYINVDQHIERKQQPVFMLEFDPAKEYDVATSSIATEDSEWSISRSGDKVRVPVFAYRTVEKMDTSVWGAGIQCGLRALHSWGDKPDSVVLIFGDKCHEVEGGYRVYLGFVMVKDKK